MGKGQVWGLILLLAVTAAVIGAARLWPAERMDEPPESESVPLAENACSPDGKYEVRQIDGGGDGEIVPSMETVQVVDRATGEVLWEDSGDCETSALWSPDGGYVALSRRSRAYSAVTVLETAGFTSWEIPLPAEARTAEYVFLHAVEWLDAETLRFRYQDMQASSQDAAARFYRCSLRMEDGRLMGSTLEEAAETLPGDYDFDHDGEPETVELVTLLDREEDRSAAAWYELRIKKANGTVLWSAGAHRSHPGWTSVFACKVDGQDYLLQYEPEVWQGWAEYSYKLFYPYIVSPVTGERQEQILRESCLVWDNNFRMEGHHFDAAELADFLEEVHGYLDDSTLLLSTEGGELRIGGSGADFREDMDFWDEYCPYDERNSLEANLRSYEAFSKEIRGIK